MIPNTINIVGVPHKVMLCKDNFAIDSHFGEFDYTKAEIKINQNTLDFEYVLCATTFGDVRPYKFGRRIGQGESHFWNGAGYVDTYVTHWMPIPEPPKEGET